MHAYHAHHMCMYTYIFVYVLFNVYTYVHTHTDARMQRERMKIEQLNLEIPYLNLFRFCNNLMHSHKIASVLNSVKIDHLHFFFYNVACVHSNLDCRINRNSQNKQTLPKILPVYSGVLLPEKSISSVFLQSSK